MGTFIGEVRASILELLADSNLSPAQKIVYLSIRQLVQIQGYYYIPSVSEIIQATGLSESGVKKARAALRSRPVWLATPEGVRTGVWMSEEWITKRTTGLPEDRYYGRYRVEQLQEVSKLLMAYEARDKRIRKKPKDPWAAVIVLLHMLTFERDQEFKQEKGKKVTVRCFCMSDLPLLAKQHRMTSKHSRKYLNQLVAILRTVGVLRQVESTRYFTIHMPGGVASPEKAPETIIEPVETSSEPEIDQQDKTVPVVQESRQEEAVRKTFEPFTFDTMHAQFLSTKDEKLKNDNIKCLREVFATFIRLEDIRGFVGPSQLAEFQKVAGRDIAKVLDQYATVEEAEKALGRSLTDAETAFYIDRWDLIQRIKSNANLPGLVNLGEDEVEETPEAKEIVIFDMTQEQRSYWRTYILDSWATIYEKFFRPGFKAGKNNPIAGRGASSLVEIMRTTGWPLWDVDEEAIKKVSLRIWVFLKRSCNKAKAKKIAYTLPWMSSRFDELRVEAEEAVDVRPQAKLPDVEEEER